MAHGDYVIRWEMRRGAAAHPFERELSSAAVPLVLAYSDVDPTSPRVERRIATSAPPRGRAAPEGAFRSFPVEVATCELRERLLEPRVARTFRRDEAACVPPLLSRRLRIGRAQW